LLAGTNAPARKSAKKGGRERDKENKNLMTIEYKITKMIRITMEDEGCTSLCRQRDTPPRCSYNRA
jgi:hypothetical protein